MSFMDRVCSCTHVSSPFNINPSFVSLSQLHWGFVTMVKAECTIVYPSYNSKSSSTEVTIQRSGLYCVRKTSIGLGGHAIDEAAMAALRAVLERRGFLGGLVGSMSVLLAMVIVPEGL